MDADLLYAKLGLTLRRSACQRCTMSEVRASGIRLYYEEHGAGEPNLCVHGTSSSAAVWRPAAIEELSKRGRAIVYDRRGCTRSERPEPYETSVVQHAEDAFWSGSDR